MMQTIATVVSLCLAVYGTAELIGRLACRCIFGKEAFDVVVWIPADDAEFRIRQLAVWKRYGYSGAAEVVVLEQEDVMLRGLCHELGLTVCTAKEWNEMHKTALQAEECGV